MIMGWAAEGVSMLAIVRDERLNPMTAMLRFSIRCEESWEDRSSPPLRNPVVLSPDDLALTG